MLGWYNLVSRIGYVLNGFFKRNIHCYIVDVNSKGEIRYKHIMHNVYLIASATCIYSDKRLLSQFSLDDAAYIKRVSEIDRVV